MYVRKFSTLNLSYTDTKGNSLLNYSLHNQRNENCETERSRITNDARFVLVP